MKDKLVVLALILILLLTGYNIQINNKNTNQITDDKIEMLQTLENNEIFLKQNKNEHNTILTYLVNIKKYLKSNNSVELFEVLEYDEEGIPARKVQVDVYSNYLVIYIYGESNEVLQVLDLPNIYIWSFNSLVYEDVNEDGHNDIKLNVTYCTGMGEFGARDYPAEVIYINKGNDYFEEPIFNPTN